VECVGTLLNENANGGREGEDVRKKGGTHDLRLERIFQVLCGRGT
jgi:hypothetical protein